MATGKLCLPFAPKPSYNIPMDFSKPDNARKINKLRVLNTLRRGKMSRADLSRELLLSKVSISEIVESLIKEGLVLEAGKDATTSGRPATMLEINKNAGRVFSVEIKKLSVSVSISDMIGHPLRFERFPRGENVWQDILSMIDKLKQDKKIYGVCFVLSDAIEFPKDLPFDYITTTSAEAQAKAEINLASMDMNGFYFVSWSDDIQAAYYNKVLIPMPSFAHIKVTKNAQCTCGGNGCLSAVASGTVLKNKTGLKNLRDITDTLEIRESAKAVVFALSEAVQATDAKAVMILGELSQMPDEAYATMQNRLTLSLPPDRNDVFIYRSQCGERGNREGAGIIALERFFYHTSLIEAIREMESAEV